MITQIVGLSLYSAFYLTQTIMIGKEPAFGQFLNIIYWTTLFYSIVDSTMNVSMLYMAYRHTKQIEVETKEQIKFNFDSILEQSNEQTEKRVRYNRYSEDMY